MAYLPRIGKTQPTKTIKTPQDYEREIEELKRLIERLQKQLTMALDALAKTRTIPVLDRLAK